MKLIVRNFGAIKRSTIDLSKKLYLFVGYNNTGKTYITRLIYEIFNPETLNDFSNSSYNKFEGTNADKFSLSKELIDTILANYSDYLKNVVVKRLLKSPPNNTHINKELQIEFKYNFNEVKKHKLKSGASIGISNPETKTEIEIYNLQKKANSLDIEILHFKMDDILAKLPNDFFDNVAKKKFEREITSVKGDVSKIFVSSLLNLLLQNKEKPFFLPSNRISILENAEELRRQEDKRRKELSEFILDLMENQSKERELISNLLAKKTESESPSFIANIINEIIKLRSNKDEDFLRNGTGFHKELLEKLINILGGEIIYEKVASISSPVEKFKLNKLDKKLVLDLASSSVNQLSTLFLYFKYWAKPERNFLMVDEPEENLHPENQILLINLLLEFITNNRLLITTHSPLVAEIINNYIILSQLDDKGQIIENNKLVNTDVSPDNTAIYFFQGDNVVEHKIENYGTIFSSFKLAQEKVFSLGDNLSELMYNQQNKI